MDDVCAFKRIVDYMREGIGIYYLDQVNGIWYSKLDCHVGQVISGINLSNGVLKGLLWQNILWIQFCVFLLRGVSSQVSSGLES